MSTLSYRPHLDGLRGIAVLAVILYHLNSSWLPGGFLGVDLFFVLSGFLITSLLLSEKDETGGIDLGRFWTRRVRRLLPASILVLLAVIVVTALLGDSLDQAARRTEVFSALAYVVNWEFILSGQSYFEGFAAVSPLRHYWSLAIEEQFYLLWPLAIFVAARKGHRNRWWVLVGAIGALSVALMALLYEPVDASRSYYGTDTRIHQILIGCLLAGLLRTRAASYLNRIPRVVPLLTLGLIFAFFVGLSDTSHLYYQGGAVVFAVLVAVQIGALEPHSRIRHILSWRPLVWTGAISYGLYLWHWPLIAWLDETTVGVGGPLLQAVRLLATFAVATLSFYLVEQPIRRGRIGPIDVNRRTLRIQFPVATAAMVAIAFFALSVSVPEWMKDPAVATEMPSTTHDGPVETKEPIAEEDVARNARDPLTIGVLGDSVMVSMLPGLRELADEKRWTLVESAVQACPIGYEPLYGYDGSISPYYESQCKVGVPQAHEDVRQSGASVVLWHDLQSSLPRRGDEGLLEPGSEAWAEDVGNEWKNVLTALGPGMDDVVIINPPLRSQSDKGCSTSPRQSRCLTIQRQDHDIREAIRTLVSSHGGSPRLHLINLDDTLCPGGYPCPEQIDGLEVRIGNNDQTHFTEEGAIWLMPHLLDAIRDTAPSLFQSDDAQANTAAP